jgi:hypothetical protein
MSAHLLILIHSACNVYKMCLAVLSVAFTLLPCVLPAGLGWPAGHCPLPALPQQQALVAGGGACREAD